MDDDIGGVETLGSRTLLRRGNRGGDGGGAAVDIGVVGLDRKGGGCGRGGADTAKVRAAAIQGQDQGPGGGRIVVGLFGDGGEVPCTSLTVTSFRVRLVTVAGVSVTMTSAVSETLRLSNSAPPEVIEAETVVVPPLT